MGGPEFLTFSCGENIFKNKDIFSFTLKISTICQKIKILKTCCNLYWSGVEHYRFQNTSMPLGPKSVLGQLVSWTIVTIPHSHQVTNIGKNTRFFNFMIIRMFMAKRATLKTGVNLPSQKQGSVWPSMGWWVNFLRRWVTTLGLVVKYWGNSESVVFHSLAVSIATNRAILKTVVLHSWAILETVVLHSWAVHNATHGKVTSQKW